MENIIKSLDFFKVTNPFRDVLVSIGGLCAFLFIQLFIGIDIFSKLKSTNLGRIEIDIIILAISFASGKLLFILGEVIIKIVLKTIDIFNYIFLEDLSLKIRLKHLKKTWGLSWKIKIKELLGLKNIKSLTYRDVENDISIIDIEKISKEYPALNDRNERTVYISIFLKSILPIALIGIIYISKYYLIIFLFLLIMSLSYNNDSKDHDYRLFRALVKYLHEEKVKK